MRILPFLFLVFSFSALAQLNTGNGTVDCVDADITGAASNVIECKTLTVTGPINSVFDPNSPLIVRVKGTVTISGSFNFQGQNGALGGAGGMAAGQSGGPSGFAGSGPAPGNPGVAGNCPAGGTADDAEGGGGGGGNLKSGAANGFSGTITVNSGLAGAGGTASIAPAFDMNSFTFAGSGGGSGGDGCQADTVDATPPGTGGGSGGGLQIVAGGNVVISGTINTNGGDGQPGTVLDGGGGGGSGGVIIIQTLGQMNLTGATLLAIGGAGGAAVNTGDGGVGGEGYIILQDADGFISCPGCNVTPTTAATAVSASNTSAKLTSDISCGTIGNKQDTHFQMLGSFLFVLIVCSTLKRRKLKI